LPEPRIWDIAAAWLIIEESGGAIDTMHNCPPFPLATKMSYASLRLPTLATASLEMWEDMYAAIRIK